MVTGNIVIEERCMKLLGPYTDNRLGIALLAFWGRHPRTRFEGCAISHALGYRRLDVTRALESMANSGLVEKQVKSGVILYSFTSDEETRKSVLEYISQGWDSWHHIARKISSTSAGDSARKAAGLVV